MLKAIIKSLLRGFAMLVVSPLLLSHRLASLFSNPDVSLESHSQLISIFPGKTGNYLRVAFYRFALDYCHPTATICFGTLLSKTGTKIGKNVYVGPRCMLGLVTLEDDVLLGPAVQIPSGPKTHGTSSTSQPIRVQRGKLRRVTVARDCWIGCNAVILEDQAEQTIVGAGSIVTKKYGVRQIIAGNPGVPIKQRPEHASSLSARQKDP